MAYPIDKGLPMPSKGSGKGRLIYPWDEMEVGDSFVTQGKSNPTSLATSAGRSRPGKTFTARKEEGVHRVWRTA